MLRSRLSVLTVTLLRLGLFVSAQDDAEIVQDDWVAPAGPDNTTVVDVGDEYTITWTSTLWTWFVDYAPSADVRNVDLWITGYYQHQYAYMVAERVQVNRSLESVWRVDVPPDELTATPYWVFRFLPSGFAFSETAESISSPGFMIVNTSATVTTTTSYSDEVRFTSTDISRSPTASTIATSLSAPTVTPTAPTDQGISTGEIAVATVGAVFGAAVFLGLGCFWPRCRRPSSTTHPTTLDRHLSNAYPEVTASSHSTKHPSLNTQSYGTTQASTLELDHYSNVKRCSPAELHG